MQMPTQYKGEEYLTVGESAEELGVSETTFINWRKALAEKHPLPTIKIPGKGARVFIRKADLGPFMDDVAAYLQGKDKQDGQ